MQLCHDCMGLSCICLVCVQTDHIGTCHIYIYIYIYVYMYLCVCCNTSHNVILKNIRLPKLVMYKFTKLCPCPTGKEYHNYIYVYIYVYLCSQFVWYITLHHPIFLNVCTALIPNGANDDAISDMIKQNYRIVLVLPHNACTPTCRIYFRHV